MKYKLLLLFFTVTISYKSFSQTVDEYINLGLDELPKSKYSSAIDYLNKAISLDPLNSETYFYKGIVYLYFIQNFDSAYIYFEKTQKLNPTNPQPYYHLARIEFFRKNYEKALTYSNKSIIHTNINSEYYKVRSNIKLKLNDSIGCILDLDTAIILNPEDNYLILERGKSFSHFNYFNKAFQDFDYIISKCGKNGLCTSGVFYEKGKAYLKQNQYDNALIEFNKEFYNRRYMIETWGNEYYLNLYYYRGLTYINLNLINQACADFKKAIDLGIDLNNPEYYLLKKYY